MLSVAKSAHAAGRLQRFVFLSTMEVAADYDSIVHDWFLDNYPRRFLNTYQIATAPPAAVVPPSMAVGKSTTGKALGYQSVNYMLDDILKPEGQELTKGCNVETCPVEILAAIVKLPGEDSEAGGRCSRTPRGIATTFASTAGSQICPIKRNVWRENRPKGCMYIAHRYVWALLSLLSRLTFGKARQQIKNQMLFLAFAFLNLRFERLGCHLPRFAEYFPILVEHFLQEARHTKKRSTATLNR